MKRFVPITLALAAVWNAPAQQTPVRFDPTVTVQSGFASTFQMTLGGTFGRGPAWQNRLTVDLANAFRKGDAVVLSGWATRDMRSGDYDWLAGFAYRLPQWRLNRHTLSASFGWQRWLLPSVLSGANDHLATISGVYRTRWKWPISVTADDWVLVKSPLRRGNVVHIQGTVAHTLWEGSHLRVVGRHGPATTYSWRFYDRPGWRVLRYGGTLALEGRRWTLEGGARQQQALAPRVPENMYWSIMLTRRIEP